MSSYNAYGLCIASEVSLPLVRIADGTPDVYICLNRRNPTLAQAPAEPEWLKFSREEAILRLDQVLFVVQGGRKVTITAAAGVTTHLIRMYLLGVIMAILLYQRGKLVLHASSVELDGSAIAFLGETGWGKSSLAAALYARGHSLIADDLTAVDFSSNPPLVLPGFPLLKITSDVAESLGYDMDSLHPMTWDNSKRAIPVQARETQTQLPLRCLFILSCGNAITIECLTPREAMIELVCHSYPTRLWLSADKTHFDQCSQLVRNVPSFTLQRSQILSSLPELAGLIEDHTRTVIN